MKTIFGKTSFLDHPWFLPIVALLMLAARLCLMFLLRHNVVFRDELDYVKIAVNLLQTHHIVSEDGPTAYRPIGESLFIAGIYKIFGPGMLAVKVAQELLLTLLPFLCAKFARLLGMTARQANVAALLASIHPALAYAVTTLYPTALTSVALTLGVLYTSVAARENSVSAAVKSGLAYGINGLLTTTFAPLPLLVGLYLGYRRQVRIALVVGLLGLLPSAAWVVRNKMVMGTWILASNGGFNLYLGANDEATPLSGNWVEPPTIPSIHTELEYDKALTSLARQWIHAHPARWAELSVARALLVVDSVGNPNTKGAHSGLAAHIVAWLMLPVILAGFAGIVVYRRAPGAVAVAMAVMLVVVSSAATLVKPRFRFPCDPALITLAVGTAAHSERKLRNKVQIVEATTVSAFQ